MDTRKKIPDPVQAEHLIKENKEMLKKLGVIEIGHFGWELKLEKVFIACHVQEYVFELTAYTRLKDFLRTVFNCEVELAIYDASEIAHDYFGRLKKVLNETQYVAI